MIDKNTIQEIKEPLAATRESLRQSAEWAKEDLAAANDRIKKLEAENSRIPELEAEVVRLTEELNGK